MKIGIFDPYLDSVSGGEKYMLSIASCLAKDHKVFIFWDKDKEAEIKEEAQRKLGIDLSAVKFHSNIFDKKVSIISRSLQSRKFDEILFLSDGSIPFVATKLFVHLQFPIEWVKNTLKNKLKLSFVKTIFCNSYFTKHFVDKKLGVKSKVLYPPVDINKKNIKKEDIILHVGRFDIDISGANYKKQDVMIRVFKKMIDKGLGWRLIMIIGVKEKDKKELDRLNEAAKGYPIEIIENPSNDNLWENYSKAKIYWHATGFDEDLEKYPEKAEHFGISTVEAMGAGVVPVVINAGGQKEIVEEGKNGYLWNTLGELLDKTASLIINKKMWSEMSLNAIEKSKIFSKEKFCKGLKKIISA